jgi:hypothetical protein
MDEMNTVILEEALDALLTRVRWYVSRRHKVPWRTARAFNMFCDVLGKPDEKCWARLRREETT